MNLRIGISLASIGLFSTILAACSAGGGASSSSFSPPLIGGISAGTPAAASLPTTSVVLAGPTVSPSTGVTTGQTTKAQVVITIAPPADALAQAISRKVAAARHAQFVSPGTNGVQLTVSQGGAQISSSVADVSSGSSLCTTINGARTCTVPLNIGSGTYTFGLTTYNESPSGGTIPGAAQQLGTASTSATVLVGQTNSISFFIGAVISSVGIGTQGTTSAYSSLPADGNTHNYAVAFIPTDASGNPISGSSSSLANPVTVSLAEAGGSGHSFLRYNGSNVGASATIAHTSDSLTIVYDGGGSAGYTMTATFAASGAPTSTLIVSPMFVTGDSKYMSGQVAFTATGQSEPFVITEQGAPGSVVFTSSGAVCPALPTGSNPLLSLPLTGNITGSGPSASMTVTANVAPKTATGCSATIADNLGTATTVPIILPMGAAIAASVAANVQIDPTHYSSGAPASLTVTQSGSPVTAISVRQNSPATLTVSELDDVTAPTVTPTGCTGIATVASSLNQGNWSSSAMGGLSGTITIVSLASGTCSIQIADGNSQSTTVTITALVSGAITEYGPLSATGHSMTVGSDGNVWVVEPPYLAKIVPATGAVTEYTPGLGGSTSNSWDITNGPDGDIWVSNPSTLFQISTSGTLLNQYGETSPNIDTIIAGPDGNIWATTESSEFAKISPTNGHVLATYSFGGGDYGNGLAIDGSGNIWTVDGVYGQGFPSIIRTTTSGTVASWGLGSVNDGGQSVLEGAIGAEFATNCWPRTELPITYGSDGNIWMVTAAFSSGCPTGNYYVSKITTAGNPTSYTEPGIPATIAAGPDGNLWVGGSFNGAGSVTRIGTNGAPTVFYQTVSNGNLHGRPTGIVAVPDGNMWFIEENGYFGKVSP